MVMIKSRFKRIMMILLYGFIGISFGDEDVAIYGFTGVWTRERGEWCRWGEERKVVGAGGVWVFWADATAVFYSGSVCAKRRLVAVERGAVGMSAFNISDCV